MRVFRSRQTNFVRALEPLAEGESKPGASPIRRTSGFVSRTAEELALGKTSILTFPAISDAGMGDDRSKMSFQAPAEFGVMS